jgi:hypothetical protein
MRHEPYEIQEEQLESAHKGQVKSRVKATTDTTQQEAVCARLRRQLAARIRTGDGIDRGNAVLVASRRWRR